MQSLLSKREVTMSFEAASLFIWMSDPASHTPVTTYVEGI